MASNPNIPNSTAMTSSRYLSDISSPNTTFVQTHPSTFRAVVQKLTGAPEKLHERRHAAKKLELELNNGGVSSWCGLFPTIMASPVSTLEGFGGGSPRGPVSPFLEEEKAIAEKGFFLHRTNPSGSGPPQLLPLFPLRSPAETSSSSSSSLSPLS